MNRKISTEDHPDQNQTISTPTIESQFSISESGSGKTTVIVLKILNIIYMNDVHPFSIFNQNLHQEAESELKLRIFSGEMKYDKYS